MMPHSTTATRKVTEREKRSVACPACGRSKGRPCVGSRIPGANTFGGGWGGPPDLDRAHNERRAAFLQATADTVRSPDKLEDAIYASPIGSTTAWRCVACNTPIATAGQPCKCTGVSVMAITKEERAALRDVAESAIWFNTTCGSAEDEALRKTLVTLAARGLVSQRLSSIGEVSEKQHFTITDAGRKALETSSGEYYVVRDDVAQKWIVRHTDTTKCYGTFEHHGHAQQDADRRNATSI